MKRSNIDLPKKRKYNNSVVIHASSPKRSRKHIDIDSSTANRYDVLSRKRRPFSLIKNGLQAQALMDNWLRAASSHQRPSSWYANLDPDKQNQIRIALGPSENKICKKLIEYTRIFLCWCKSRCCNIQTCPTASTTN